ncbi:MAG: AbrB/MazE/SpoVT family DNA-binding domain-containing protein [Pseudomonadota bacterium]
MLVTKLTAKCQTTIPSKVRRVLGVKAGDSVMFTVSGRKVTLRRAEKLDAGFLKLANDGFSDWNTPEADRAFRDL